MYVPGRYGREVRTDIATEGAHGHITGLACAEIAPRKKAQDRIRKSLAIALLQRTCELGRKANDKDAAAQLMASAHKKRSKRVYYCMRKRRPKP